MLHHLPISLKVPSEYAQDTGEEELILYEEEDMQDDAYAEDEETAYEEEDTGPEQGTSGNEDSAGQEQAPLIDEDGSYTTKEDVALYIHTYGHLPSNYISKKQAEALGWTGGSLEPYAPGKSLGGTYFGNYEGKLPDAKGRKWAECDVNNQGRKSRGAERLVYSNDGLIYYTPDHYESFVLLYGEEP